MGYAAAAAALIAALTLVLYRPGLDGPLLLDDFAHLQPLIDAAPAGSGSAWTQLRSHASPLGRPLAMLTFTANAALHGADLAAWKLTNVLAHLLAGVCLALCCAAAARAAGPRAAAAAPALALAVAALWILHPLHLGTVLYTVQRMTVLSALFVLAGLALYLDGRWRMAAGAGGGRRRLFAAFGLCLPLAVLSKETGVLLPALCAIAELVLVRHAAQARTPRLVAALLLGSTVVPLAVLAGVYAWHYEALVAAPFAARDFGPLERMLTELRVLVRYVGQVLVPVPAAFGFIHDDLVPSRGLLQPPFTAAALAALAALAASALWWRRRCPLYAFGVLAFLAAHSLEASFLPLELMFEHRNYLPSAFLLLGVAGALAAVPAQAAVKRAAFGTALVLLALVTGLRAPVWASAPALYADMLRLHPDSPFAAAMVAELLSQDGAHGAAAAVLDGRPGAGPAIQRLVLACRRGEPISAAMLRSAGGQGPVDAYQGEGLITLAELGLDGRCDLDASAFADRLAGVVERPIAQARTAFTLRIYQAHYLHRSARTAAALAALESAQALRARDPMPSLFAAELAFAAGRTGRAQAYYARAAAVDARGGGRHAHAVAAVGRLLGRAPSSLQGDPQP